MFKITNNLDSKRDKIFKEYLHVTDFTAVSARALLPQMF